MKTADPAQQTWWDTFTAAASPTQTSPAASILGLCSHTNFQVNFSVGFSRVFGLSFFCTPQAKISQPSAWTLPFEPLVVSTEATPPQGSVGRGEERGPCSLHPPTSANTQRSCGSCHHHLHTAQSLDYLKHDFPIS